MNDTGEGTRALLGVLAATARGSRRDGAFAVWLTVRVAGDLAACDGPADRAHRRRVQALERRLTSLSLPPPLRRALAGTLAHLRDATPAAGRLALSQLVAPVRDTLGQEAGEAVRRVAASVREGVALP